MVSCGTTLIVGILWHDLGIHSRRPASPSVGGVGGELPPHVNPDGLEGLRAQGGSALRSSLAMKPDCFETVRV